MSGRCFNFFVKLIFIFVTSVSSVYAQEKEIDLVVSYKMVNFAGKWRPAMAVNNQIPAPVLRFREGDYIRLNVYNQLDKPTAIHWHGVLVPWQMDGVEHVSQKDIPPQKVFHYQFTLKQRGTYWYHAHAHVQEQEGLYGAFIIDPPHQSEAYQYNKDYVIVLSDWSNTPAENIFMNLKKTGDYYSPRFPLQSSLTKFLTDYYKADYKERKQLISDYKMMQQMRMSIYDISDIAYDAYLLNGRTKYCPWTANVHVGDVVRLRFIGAAASTIYRVKIVDEQMQMVHVQGNDVYPYTISDFSIAPGETYDVLVKIKKNKPYIIYAESIDTRGKAYGALITDVRQVINYQSVIPFPEPKPVTRDMMANMMGGMHHDAHGMSENSAHEMKMPVEPTIVGDRISPPHFSHEETSGTKYQNIKARVKTNNPNLPVRGIIRMELFGYMGRFIWFINGLPEYKARPIRIMPGKRYRIVFTNNSMMRHPMHIHGHWFILRNGHGVYDPLLHTIEVPPGATVVADIDADASGQWFFHCHHLYHMVSGMARVFQYATLIEIVKGELKPQSYSKQTAYINRPIVREDAVMPIDTALVRHPMGHPAGFFFANFIDVGVDPFQNIQRGNFKGLYGDDYNKLELFTNDAEINRGKIENADIDIFYWRLIGQFWAIKAGINYFYRPAERAYLQPGMAIEGLLPYFIDVDARTYFHNNSFKLDLEFLRDTQITNNFFIRAAVRSIFATKTVIADGVTSGINQMRYLVRPFYRLRPDLTLFAEYEHEHYYGALVDLRHKDDEPAQENTITFGLSILF